MDPRTDAEVIVCSFKSPGSFGELFDRHATTMFRYFVRRVGPDDADSLLGELFRIAFEKRAGFDTERAEARPWLYGIASNLLARHRQGEARRLDATARSVNTSVTASDLFSEVDARLDASRLWADVAVAIATLPQGERDTLLLFAWEGMPYDQIATALDVPVGTVRSRLNRARGRLRELVGESEEERVTATLRPDRVFPVDEGDPGLFKREKERLMSTIGATTPQTEAWSRTPAMYPRLTYADEVAALEYLTRVFQFTERREARMGNGDDEEGMLAWLEFGDGVVMIGRATAAAREVHHLYSPGDVGHATVMINVAVNDINTPSPRAPRSRCRSRMPFTVSGATRPTISKATTGTSQSRSKRSGRANKTLADTARCPIACPLGAGRVRHLTDAPRRYGAKPHPRNTRASHRENARWPRNYDDSRVLLRNPAITP
jgi:RNA polymerase sigma factor (sigma-70 family)